MNTQRTLTRNAIVLGLLALAVGLVFTGWLMGRWVAAGEKPIATIVTATIELPADRNTPTVHPDKYPPESWAYPPGDPYQAEPYIPPPTQHVVLPTSIPMQEYVDASGQFTVTLPAEWKPGDEPGSFLGKDGSANIRFLPDMGYQSSITQVCERLTRKPEFIEYRPTLGNQHVQSLNCELRPAANIQLVGIRVIRNNSPDPEQRYILLETDPDNFAQISASLVVRYPQSPYKGSAFALPTAPLSITDQAFWDEISALPGLIISEIPLENMPGGGPNEWGSNNPAAAILRDLRRSPIADGPTPTSTSLPEVRLDKTNAILTRFGFRLEAVEDDARRYTLYLEDQKVLADIESYNDPLLSDSARDFGLQVRVFHQGDCLIRNHDLDCWNTLLNRQVVGGPFFIGERLYWAIYNTSTHLVEVWSDKLVVFTYAGVYTVRPPGERFLRMGDDWVLLVHHTVIQSGVILNDTLRYEEIIDWQLVNDKPVYFFRKGPRVGVSFRGIILPVSYDWVASGVCCGMTQYYPRIRPGDMEFFAFRDGLWYFVELKLPD